MTATAQPTNFDIARAAFYGAYPTLDAIIRTATGYKMGDIWYPSNGCDLSTYTAIVESMDAHVLDAIIALDVTA